MLHRKWADSNIRFYCVTVIGRSWRTLNIMYPNESPSISMTLFEGQNKINIQYEQVNIDLILLIA
jgi:hypothetical protein